MRRTCSTRSGKPLVIDLRGRWHRGGHKIGWGMRSAVALRQSWRAGVVAAARLMAARLHRCARATLMQKHTAYAESGNYENRPSGSNRHGRSAEHRREGTQIHDYVKPVARGTSPRRPFPSAGSVSDSGRSIQPCAASSSGIWCFRSRAKTREPRARAQQRRHDLFRVSAKKTTTRSSSLVRLTHARAGRTVAGSRHRRSERRRPEEVRQEAQEEGLPVP